MKERTQQQLTAALFCGLLLAAALGYLLLPKAGFSQQEKRFLAEAPALSWQSLTSGQWAEEAEDWMADHMPGRDFLVGLNAYFELLTGRQSGKDIRLVDDRLVEAPVQPDDAALNCNLTAIRRFAETANQSVTLALVPSAGWALGGTDYPDEALITQANEQAGALLHPLDLLPLFRNHPELYYKTDHHWTSAGAYAAYRAFLESQGRTPVPEEAFQKQVVPGFQGSTYSRSALWLTPAEPLELWQGPAECTVVNESQPDPHPGVFYQERLEEADKYTVFLDGNHGLVRIQNPTGQGKLLVIRDSFSNCLGCFLSQSYAQVVLADLRYYKQPLSQLAAQEGFDAILVCYSLSNFLTDQNLIFLR